MLVGNFIAKKLMDDALRITVEVLAFNVGYFQFILYASDNIRIYISVKNERTR